MPNPLNILVTGGNGFLGSHIVKALLKEGHHVRILSRNASAQPFAKYVEDGEGHVTAIQANLTNHAAVAAACKGAGAIFHTAALAGYWGQHSAYYNANVLGTQNLLNAAKACGVPNFIYTSTPSVVFNGQPIKNGNESLPVHSPYRAYAEKAGIPYPSVHAATDAQWAHAAPTSSNNSKSTPSHNRREEAGDKQRREQGKEAAKKNIHTFNKKINLKFITQHSPHLCFYTATKAEAELRVLAANTPTLRTVALRPHLIWGAEDPHLMPRVAARAKAGKLVQVGSGHNEADFTHVTHAAQAHTLALQHIQAAAGKAYFITDGQPTNLWGWVNRACTGLGLQPPKRQIPLKTALRIGKVLENVYTWAPTSAAIHALFGKHAEPRLTRFVATELGKHHTFNINAAKTDLHYAPATDTSAQWESMLAYIRTNVLS